MSQALVILNDRGRAYDYAPNESIKFILSAAETSGQFDIAESQYSYLGGPPLHIHTQQDETHYILEGKLRYQIEEEAIDLEPGDSIYIPKGTPHAWINLEQEPARAIVVLNPGGSEGFFQTVSSPPSEQIDFETLAKVARDYHTEIVGPPLSISLGLVNGEAANI
ncbi:MAG: cupin domain-containing protein [Spirulina sp.]